jgi:hypothetical protein
MANVFSSNPVYIDTDTTVAGNTNWKGSSGGSKYTGGIGIRPFAILVTPTGAAFTAGNIVINEVNAGGTTGPKLFSIDVLATQWPTEYIFNAPPGWHDFIVTGVTATAAAIEIYYRV